MAVVRSVREWRGGRDRAHIAEAVGVEQGRMRAMGMREGAARSEFQGMLAVVTCPQCRLPICGQSYLPPQFSLLDLLFF